MPETQAITIDKLGKAQRTALLALRKPVTDAAAKFAAVREKLTDLAPRVVKLFNAISAEHEEFTFVDFARMFAPDIPTNAADREGKPGYRSHRVYYTLDYMRRLVRTKNRPRGQQGVRDSAADALARTLATMLQLVDDPAALWNAVQSEFQYGERVMTRLRKRVEATKPLVRLTVSKPATVKGVIHMERLQETTATNPRVTVETKAA